MSPKKLSPSDQKIGLIVPQDPLHNEVDKLRQSMGSGWIQHLLKVFPPDPSMIKPVDPSYRIAQDKAPAMTSQEEAEEDRLSAKRFAERPLNKARIY